MGDIPRADPDATPRMGKRGEARREKSIFRETGDEWLVEVTPLRVGRAGYTFEVRAEFPAAVLPEFRFDQNERVRRSAEHYIVDAELARRVAVDVARRLAAGERDIFLPKVEAELR